VVDSTRLNPVSFFCVGGNKVTHPSTEWLQTSRDFWEKRYWDVEAELAKAKKTIARLSRQVKKLKAKA
jgi:hypothetical protein